MGLLCELLSVGQEGAGGVVQFTTARTTLTCGEERTVARCLLPAQQLLLLVEIKPHDESVVLELVV